MNMDGQCPVKTLVIIHLIENPRDDFLPSRGKKENSC